MAFFIPRPLGPQRKGGIVLFALCGWYTMFPPRMSAQHAAQCVEPPLIAVEKKKETHRFSRVPFLEQRHFS